MIRMWLFVCDSEFCLHELAVDESSPSAARYQARESEWESTLDGNRWFCPLHRRRAAMMWARQDHQDWCPYRTRRGACCCHGDISSMVSDTYGQGLRRGDRERGIESVRPDGGYL
jgi:hypothetical protein